MKTLTILASALLLAMSASVFASDDGGTDDETVNRRDDGRPGQGTCEQGAEKECVNEKTYMENDITCKKTVYQGGRVHVETVPCCSWMDTTQYVCYACEGKQRTTRAVGAANVRWNSGVHRGQCNGGGGDNISMKISGAHGALDAVEGWSISGELSMQPDEYGNYQESSSGTGIALMGGSESLADDCAIIPAPAPVDEDEVSSDEIKVIR